MKPFAHVPLKEVAEVISGYAFKSVDLTRKSEDIPVLKIANVTPPVATLIFYDHFPPKLVTNKLSKYVVKNHDVLVAMTGMGSVGRIAIAKGIDKKIFLNQRVGIIRAKRNISAMSPYH
jgi:type I restriction enzyme S subunit